MMEQIGMVVPWFGSGGSDRYLRRYCGVRRRPVCREWDSLESRRRRFCGSDAIQFETSNSPG
jgi:hypothetical protein